MDKLQKIIVASLLSTAGLSWLLSATQPDMMNVMMTYNPVLVLLFTASWTAGMARNDVSSYSTNGPSLQ